MAVRNPTTTGDLLPESVPAGPTEGDVKPLKMTSPYGSTVTVDKSLSDAYKAAGYK